MRKWPVRRWATAAVATPLITAALAAFGWPAEPRPSLITLTVAASLLGGLIVASYMPVSGRGIDLGCGPCAVMSGVTIVGAMVAMSTYAGSLLGPVGAALLMTFGLTQRLTQPPSCPTPLSRHSAAPTEPGRAEKLSER